MDPITLRFFIAVVALVGAAVFGWLCHRWGRKSGYADGYDDGRTKGLLEGAVVGGGVAAPQGAGGTRPVIR